MFIRLKNKRPAVEEAQESEFVDAVKYQFPERPDFPRSSDVIRIDEYFVPSRNIVINKYGSNKSDHPRHEDGGVRTTYPDGRVEVKGVVEVSQLENVKLSKALVDKAEVVANAKEVMNTATEELESMQDYREIMANERYFSPRLK